MCTHCKLDCPPLRGASTGNFEDLFTVRPLARIFERNAKSLKKKVLLQKWTFCTPMAAGLSTVVPYCTDLWTVNKKPYPLFKLSQWHDFRSILTNKQVYLDISPLKQYKLLVIFLPPQSDTRNAHPDSPWLLTSCVVLICSTAVATVSQQLTQSTTEGTIWGSV